MKYNKNLKLILLDIDGVLFNSKLNMQLSWEEVKKKLNVKKNFKKYFREIGRPFQDVLKKIGIYKNLNQIEKLYQQSSIKYFDKIKPYPYVLSTLTKLYEKKNVVLGILTSKHRGRTLKLFKKYNLRFKIISTPTKGLRGKPYPDQINKILKKLKISKKKTVYVGDMYVDFITAKNSGIKYIHTSYGYGKNKKEYRYKINNFKEMSKMIDRL